MAIEDRNLEPGTQLIAKYKKEEYKAEVIAGEDGKVKYRLADGREFKSPSSAGTAITNKACNGWAFWSVEAGGGPQRSGGARGRRIGRNGDWEQTPTAGFRRVPNQKGIEEGEVRLYCDACQKSFTAPVGAPAEQCPEGHTSNGVQEATTEA